MTKNSVDDSRMPLLTGRQVDQRAGLIAVAAFLVPIGAWLTSLAMSYSVQDFACSAAASAARVAPETLLRGILVAMNAVLLVLTLLSALAGFTVAYRSARLQGSATIAFLGTASGALGLVFGFGVVLIGLNPLFFGVCR